ncbi:MAG: ABC transporter substrate-binding protein [Sphaerobacteraceae bacterium]|nr:MAG: ABC transporter substrate-binding protein [Sphaerobacteraceae bacterium]
MADRRAIDALTNDVLEGRLDRRTLLKRAAILGITTPALAGLIAACEDDDADDSDDGVAAEPDDDEELDDEELSDLDDEDVIPEDAEVDIDEIGEVPRERTLFLRWGGQEGRFVDHDLWNGYAIGANHQNGLGILYEPLAYYSAFADETYPWLAEDWEYNDDSTELTINLRSGIEWSDGEPFTADDVAFTLNHLVEIGSEVRWGTDVQQFVESAEAVDDTTVHVTFNVPAPRFMFFMTYKYDIGLYIIPQHIYEGEDWSTFTCFDLDEGLPVTTGPWEVVFSSPEQKIIDRRDSWWAIDQGLVDDLPGPERVVYLPFGDETGVAQQLITDQIDCSLDLRPMTIVRVMEDNPNVVTHTLGEPPYGYVDWWPTALFLNHEEPPFDELEVRWGISYYIDREQMIEVAYDGAGSVSPLPLPSYPGLEPYVEHVSDILEEYDTLEYNPEKGDEMFEAAGFQRNGSGFWERDGEVLEMTLNGFEVFADIGPIVAEMLRQNGIDAEYAQPPDWSDMIQQGNYRAGFQGHGGSVSNDPYDTLRLFQSVTVAVPGAHGVNFTQWQNEEYDQIVDEIAVTPIDDQDRLMELFHDAMEIWIPELPNIQIQEWYHRVPMNTTFWEGWPTVENEYVNGAFWHLTFQLVLNELQPTQ